MKILTLVKFKYIDKYCDFPLLGNLISLDASGNRNAFLSTRILEGAGFTGIEDVTSDGEEDQGFSDFKNYIFNFKEIKGLNILKSIEEDSKYKKEEVFSYLSRFIALKKFDRALSNPSILEKAIPHYKPKNKLFNEFNLNSKDIKCEDSIISSRIRVIPDKDIYALKVGLDSNCCQHLGGAAKYVAVESLVGENSGVIMFESKV